jgi:hypothetical protein
MYKFYEKLYKFTGQLIDKIVMAKHKLNAPYCEE